jgi:hypothetical protein
MKNYTKSELQSMSDWELVELYCDEMGGIDENDLMIEVRGNKAERENLIYHLLQRTKHAKGGSLKGNQSKLDLNKNGKLDSNDFKMLRGKKATGGGVRDYKGINGKDKFIADQLFHVISLKSISEKKNTIKNSLLPNIDSYKLDEMTKKITKDNLQYALSQKNVSSLNKVLTTSINAFRDDKKGNGGGTGVSSETGYAEGTNASLLMNQDYLAYAEGGAVGNVQIPKKLEGELTYVVKDAESKGVDMPELKKLLKGDNNIIEAHKEYRENVNVGGDIRVPYEFSNRFTDFVIGYLPGKKKRFFLNKYGESLIEKEYPWYANGGGVGNDWFNKGVGTNGLNKIKEHSKQNPKILFLVTDDNYSNIGSYYLLDGKFAKKTVANASYDLQKSKVNLKPKSDVIYKMKQLGDPNGYYANGGSLADTPESFPSTDAMSYKNGGGVDDKMLETEAKNKLMSLKESGEIILRTGNHGQIFMSLIGGQLKSYDNYTKALHHYTLAKNTQSMATGGSTSGWCYSIGGL